MSSCCAPDGTCSNDTPHKKHKKSVEAKPEFHFLTKLNEEQLKKSVAVLQEVQGLSDLAEQQAQIKVSLEAHLPKYFLKKLLKSCQSRDIDGVLPQVEKHLSELD